MSVALAPRPPIVTGVTGHEFGEPERRAVYRAIAERRGMPSEAEPVAHLCLGPVPAFPDRPMRELEAWALRRPPSDLTYENGWEATCSEEVPPA